MAMPEKMFQLIGAFVLGYCLGYHMFEILRYKNQKEEINDFFSNYNKKYDPQQCRRSCEKMAETKISDDIFFGEDLSLEKKILTAVTENLGKDLKHCAVSNYLSKKSMTICCETFVLTRDTAKKVLDVVDNVLKEHSFSNFGLSKLGWCSNYMLAQRFINYPMENSSFKKTQIIEFYWFNRSPVRYDKNKSLQDLKICCDCLHCHIFKLK